MIAPVANAMDRTLWEERRTCVRSLLQTPLIHAEGPNRDVFRLVRRHFDWLRHWFAEEPAWHVHIENDHVRLFKYPARLCDGSRPALDVRQGVPFSRRRYVLLCLTLAALEKSERQTALGTLAERIMMMAHGDPVFADAGLDVRFERRAERSDLVAVIRLLASWGVLARIHGSEEGYVQQSEDALYNIHRPLLARTLAVRRGPSTVDETALADRLERIQSEMLPESEDGRRRTLRTTLTRLLLDDPVVYYKDLSEDELNYLHSQRGRLVRVIEEATGLVAEVRGEGIAMVDPQRSLTDYRMPEEGTDGHAALLLAEFLVDHLRDRGDEPISTSRVEQRLDELIRIHGKRWRNAVRDPGGMRELLRGVLDRLEALQLIRRVGETLWPLPALGRYRIKLDASLS